MDRLYGEYPYTYEDMERQKGMDWVVKYLRMKHVIVFLIHFILASEQTATLKEIRRHYLAENPGAVLSVEVRASPVAVLF